MMPEYEVTYYVEEVRKYGDIPDDLTESQVAQIMEAMRKDGE